MGDTVKLRPNHYELLGLTPAASMDEIRQAFARQLSLISVRPFGWLAQISVAHETLRNPAKRKAYDAALFPKPAAPQRKPGGHPVMAQLFRPASPPPAEPAVEAPIAAFPRRPIDAWKPAPLAPIVFKPPRPAPDPLPPRTPLTAEEMVRRTFLEERGHQPRAEVEPDLRRDSLETIAADADATLDWRLPALAAGALVLALAGGAWLGLESGNDNPDALPDQAATMKVTPPRTAPTIEAAPATPPIAEVQPEQPVRAPVVAPVERVRAPLEIELPDPQAEPAQADQASTEAGVVEETASSDVPIAATSTARLPLSDATVARTIRRIGYPCSAVASTTAMDAAGTFKVTCTSGHAYRAAPVRGRYRFKRLGG